jgi:hypothetical protein
MKITFFHSLNSLFIDNDDNTHSIDLSSTVPLCASHAVFATAAAILYQIIQLKNNKIFTLHSIVVDDGNGGC